MFQGPLFIISSLAISIMICKLHKQSRRHPGADSSRVGKYPCFSRFVMYVAKIELKVRGQSLAVQHYKLSVVLSCYSTPPDGMTS